MATQCLLEWVAITNPINEITLEVNFGYITFIFISILAVADAVRTSLGPKGMDKMVSFELGVCVYVCVCVVCAYNKAVQSI